MRKMKGIQYNLKNNLPKPGNFAFSLRAAISGIDLLNPSAKVPKEYQYTVFFSSLSGKTYKASECWSITAESAKIARELIKQLIIDTGAIDYLLEDNFSVKRTGSVFTVFEPWPYNFI